MAEKQGKATAGEAVRRYHASRTPEQRAEWRNRVSAGTTAGMLDWHRARSPEQRQQTRERQRDAAVCRVFQPRRPGTTLQKGQRPVQTPETPALRALAKVQHASIKRIMRDLASTDPDMFREAIIEGLQARPPASFPYIALAAAYLDGKPINAEAAGDGRADLTGLTGDELIARALAIAAHLRQEAEAREGQLRPAIDVTPSEEERP